MVAEGRPPCGKADQRGELGAGSGPTGAIAISDGSSQAQAATDKMEGS